MAATANSDSGFMQGNPDGQSEQVPFSDNDTPANDTSIDEDDSPGDSPEQRLSRRQKRQERLQSLLREGEESKKRLAEFEERDAKRERELAEMRGQLTALQQMRQPANDAERPNQYKQRLDAVYARQREAYAAAQAEIKAGTYNDERNRYYDRVAEEIETEKARIHTEWAIAEREPERQRQAAQAQWVNRYPEVYRDARALQYAEATYRQRLALENVQPSHELVESVMEETIAKFRLGPKKAPTATERQRFTGLPASGAGGATRDTGVAMTPELRRIAVAAHPDLPEAEAVRKWVNGPGKRLREKKIL